MKNKSICILVTLVAICLVYIRMSEEVINYNNYFTIDNEVKYVDSDIIEESVVDEQLEEVVISTETINKEVFVATVKEESPLVQEEKELVEVPAALEQQNEILVGNMSGYGPDCIGCSGYLANGHYVGDGNIYYNDSEYGQVRIVAGDRKYKFGTIVRINDSLLAVVLDRGGAIGIGKKFTFDLLYENEKIANQNGVSYNAKFEILRNGF